MSIPPFFDFLTLSYNDCFVFYRKLMLSGEQIFFQTVELLAPADGRAARGVRFERVDLMDRDFRLAVVVGEPSKPGPYLIRVKAASGAKLMPHRHPEDRIYTVMSGVFYIGLGEKFDGDKVKAYPPGAVIVLPGDTWHFHWAKSGEYVTQVTGIGPLGLEYRNI